jgi:hypothetical protein
MSKANSLRTQERYADYDGDMMLILRVYDLF